MKFVILFICILCLVSGQYERVLMRDIEVLTLHAGRMTASRRTSPVPELKCVGVLCDVRLPDTVQCYNRGLDDRGIVQWKCEGKLPAGYYFKTLEVGCEGFEDRDDPFVLAGSCGLEYTLRTDNIRFKEDVHADIGGWFLIFLIFMIVLIILFIADQQQHHYHHVRRSYPRHVYYDCDDEYHYNSCPRTRRNVYYNTSSRRSSSPHTDTGYASTRNR